MPRRTLAPARSWDWRRLCCERGWRGAEVLVALQVSNMAYEARDQAQLEIQTLQGQAEKEQARTLEVVAAQWFRYW